MPVILKEVSEGDHLFGQPRKWYFNLLQNLNELRHHEGENNKHEGDRRPYQDGRINQRLLDISIQLVQPVDVATQLRTDLRQSAAFLRNF